MTWQTILKDVKFAHPQELKRITKEAQELANKENEAKAIWVHYKGWDEFEYFFIDDGTKYVGRVFDEGSEGSKIDSMPNMELVAVVVPAGD